MKNKKEHIDLIIDQENCNPFGFVITTSHDKLVKTIYEVLEKNEGEWSVKDIFNALQNKKFINGIFTDFSKIYI